MNRPENRLGNERFARFSRSWGELNEGLSYSTRQAKESDLAMAVSCRESCLTALVIAQGRLTDTRTERSRAGLAQGQPAEGGASEMSDSTIAALAPKAPAVCPSHPLET
eukprot:229032-Pleurochrysis_carterae.AAC.1